MEQKIGDLINQMEQFGDRFYVTDNGINEVYWNPDADSGGQIVNNEISFAIIEQAAQYENPNEFFDYLGTNCKQYLIDIDEPGCAEYAKYLLSRVPSFTECTEHTMRELLRNTLIDKAKTEQNRFVEELKSKRPEEIITASYEKVIRDEFINSFEEPFLNTGQLKKLIQLDYPLEACYQAWIDTDISLSDVLNHSTELFTDTLQGNSALKPYAPNFEDVISEQGCNDNFDMEM